MLSEIQCRRKDLTHKYIKMVQEIRRPLDSRRVGIRPLLLLLSILSIPTHFYVVSAGGNIYSTSSIILPVVFKGLGKAVPDPSKFPFDVIMLAYHTYIHTRPYHTYGIPYVWYGMVCIVSKHNGKIHRFNNNTKQCQNAE